MGLRGRRRGGGLPRVFGGGPRGGIPVRFSDFARSARPWGNAQLTPRALSCGGGRREPDRVPDLGRGSIWETDVLLWGRLLAPVSLRADTAHGAAGAGRRPAGGLLRSSARDRPRAPAPAHERRPPVQVLC